MTQGQFQSMIQSEEIQSRFDAILGEGNGAPFLMSVFGCYVKDKKLQECNAQSILMAAAKGASLGLTFDPNFGMCFIKPIREKVSHGYVKKAQFQMGYKGFIELGHRSQQYRYLNVTDVREGEFKGIDRMTGVIEIEGIQDTDERNSKPVIGYISYFELLNGFSKSLYMTIKELKDHAKKWSESYGEKDSSWSDDRFPGMAKKTVLKLNLDRWSPKSVQMQRAIKADQSVVLDWEGVKLSYPDNPNHLVVKPLEVIEAERADESARAHIEISTSVEQLESLYEHIPNADVRKLYDEKMAILKAKK